ncbi:MAG: hypothetical protein JSV07_07635 [Acidimicrobiia bacterium]|nr:MAG: hypothetical protein JSV07_07635 [Acidimicrobiia bacterium]
MSTNTDPLERLELLSHSELLEVATGIFEGSERGDDWDFIAYLVFELAEKFEGKNWPSLGAWMHDLQDSPDDDHQTLASWIAGSLEAIDDRLREVKSNPENHWADSRTLVAHLRLHIEGGQRASKKPIGICPDCFAFSAVQRLPANDQETIRFGFEGVDRKPERFQVVIAHEMSCSFWE